MKKLTISNLFLYRHRFVIGYALLAIAFIGLLLALPLASPEGLSEPEMESAVDSYALSLSSLTSGKLVDLPYHILQKLSILAFGLTPYAIKLPSILVALALGFLLILLLNRWFKNNVALLASVITVLSTPFLYLAGSGTPLIMIVFWPVLLLWLGSKIQGVKKPRPLYCIIFAFIMLASIFTPYMVYLDTFILVFALAQPHLRFTIKTLPKLPLLTTTVIIAGGVAIFAFNLLNRPSDLALLFSSPSYSAAAMPDNFATALSMLFSWNGQMEGIYLVPLISLATAFLAVIGLFSTAKGFFASRNAIASLLIIFTLCLAAVNPESIVLMILPLAILTAHGLRYILQKWYGLFPENPYARVAGLIPIVTFIGCILITGLAHYILGYRYNPIVASNFQTDLELLNELAPSSAILLPEEGLARDFYSIKGDRGELTLLFDLSSRPASFLSLGKMTELDDSNYHIERIITSPKSDNSDRIYMYSSN